MTLPKDTTHYILRGVDPTLYYTFGVRAYRVVDPDIHGSGVLKSAIVKPTLGVENPYHPEANTAWPGDVTGTVGGLPVDKVARIVGCGDGSDGALSTTGTSLSALTENRLSNNIPHRKQRPYDHHLPRCKDLFSGGGRRGDTRWRQDPHG